MNEDIINILVIDDSPYDRELIKQNLMKHFPEAVFIFGEGLNDYKERVSWVKPDVILCDYEMKDCNGLDILLLSKKAWEVPFVFVTGALNDEERVANTILKGANGYVLKDNLSDLNKVVERAIIESKKVKQRKKDREELYNLINLELEKAKILAEREGPYSEIKECLMNLEHKLQDVNS